MKLLQLLLLVAIGSLCSCNEKRELVHINVADIAAVSDKSLHLDDSKIRENIRHFVMADTGRERADIHARRHYLGGGDLVWITRGGVSGKADSLLSYVVRIEAEGIPREHFLYSDISADLERVRNMRFDETRNADINRVYARLEFHLTKAFLRYVEGQRFGYVDPYETFNRLDVRDSDSVRVSYRQLYDIHTRRPDKQFVASAFAVIVQPDDSVAAFLRDSHPENPLYYTLLQHLQGGLSQPERRRVMANMERARWRVGDYPHLHKKYVLVNIPSVHLLAVDGSERMTMRIGLGSLETKTPLLTSRIKRMDFNPQWVIPKSIIKKSVANHAGSSSYFNSHNYFIQQRSTGKTVDPVHATRDMLLSSDYSVIQRGGIGNALGRVIFRFDNNFSIFMHDTSNPGVFSQADRSVSHGCIRVERPFDLAVFMLDDKDESLIDRMRYSMTVKYAQGARQQADDDVQVDKKRLVHSVPVKPEVPVFITYFTIYPDADGRLVDYPDIYGFDAALLNCLDKIF